MTMEIPSDNDRFRQELEFVQCLASPSYLNCNVLFIQINSVSIDLAQEEYLTNVDFIAFLRYLNYWKLPQYRRYILYPQCLYFLDKLNEAAEKGAGEDMRHIQSTLAKSEVMAFIHQQQFYSWRLKSSHENEGQSL